MHACMHTQSTNTNTEPQTTNHHQHHHYHHPHSHTHARIQKQNQKTTTTNTTTLTNTHKRTLRFPFSRPNFFCFCCSSYRVKSCGFQSWSEHTIHLPFFTYRAVARQSGQRALAHRRHCSFPFLFYFLWRGGAGRNRGWDIGETKGMIIVILLYYLLEQKQTTQGP